MDYVQSRFNMGEQTALFMAVERGHTDVVRRLLQNDVDVNKANCDGVTPLMVCITRKEVNKEMFRILMKAGANIHNSCNPKYSFPH